MVVSGAGLRDRVDGQPLRPHEILLPVITFGPHKRRGPYRSGGVGLIDETEREVQREDLCPAIVRPSRGIPERDIREQEARRTCRLHDIARRPHHDGRDPVLLEMARSQRDGLVAHGTVRHEDRHIGAVRTQGLEQGRRVHLPRGPLAAIGRQAEQARGKRADVTICPGRPQGGERQIGPDVGRAGMGAIIGHVRDAQVRDPVGGAGIHPIEFRARIVGRIRALVPCIGVEWGGGRHQSHRQFGHAARRAMKWHGGIVRPGIGVQVAECGIVGPRSRDVRNRFAA